MSDPTEVSRRTLLKAGAAAAVSAGATTASAPVAAVEPEPEPPTGRPGADRFAKPGSPSRKAERAWARAEYDHQKRMRDEYAQQSGPDDDEDDDDDESGSGNTSSSGPGSPTSPNFDRVLDAVEDVGCDPSGNRPISEDMDGSVMQDGTLVVFPGGRFRISSKFHVSVDGTFGLVGAGYQEVNSPPTPGSDTAMIVTPPQSRTRLILTATTGLFANFVVDQRTESSLTGFAVESKGFVQARDVRFVGVQDNTGNVPDSYGVSPCALQSDPGATVRAERIVGRYIGLPGDKNSGGSPMFWVGETNRGLAQIGHCVSQGAADNGVYGGRTEGDVHIKGGKWINNEVAQLRYSGRGSWADGATLVVDKSRYEGPTAGGGFNEVFATNGVKIERNEDTDKPSGTVVRNLDIRVRNVGSMGIGAPIFVRGHGGATKIDNCRVLCTLDQPSVIGNPPGSSYAPAAPPPQNVTITESLFEGTNGGEVIRIEDRPNSLIKNSCLKTPGAGPGSITGNIRIGSNMGYGRTCQSGGLRAPDQVGSAGNLSAMNISYNGSYNGSAATQTPPRVRARGSGGGSFFAALFGGIGLLLLMIIMVPVSFLVLLWQILND